MQPRVMVVDDEPDISLITGQLLKLEGIQAHCFNNSNSAFEQFAKDPKGYDVIVTDVRMPDITGIELANAIHAVNAEIPIIFMTAFDLKNDDLPEFMVKEDVIKKPFLGRQLFFRIIQRLKTKIAAV